VRNNARGNRNAPCACGVISLVILIGSLYMLRGFALYIIGGFALMCVYNGFRDYLYATDEELEDKTRL